MRAKVATGRAGGATTPVEAPKMTIRFRTSGVSSADRECRGNAEVGSRVQTERWGLEETKKFYEALQRFGTDFTLMQSAFPGRTQRQLKNKFKKEEKAHRALVTLALQPNIARPLPSAERRAPQPKILIGSQYVFTVYPTGVTDVTEVTNNINAMADTKEIHRQLHSVIPG